MTLTAGRFTEEGTSKFVNVDGVELHYHEAGEGEPLVCLNGFGPGMSAWLTYYRNLEALSQNYRVLLVDTPGFGRSQPIVVDNEPGHAVDARYIKGLMDALDIEKASLIGISQGGTTALIFSLNYTERVTKLVMAGCNASIGGNVFLFNPPSMEGIRLAGEASRDPSRENIKRSLKALVFNEAATTDELVDHMYALANNIELAEARRVAQSKSKRTRQNLLNELPSFTKPVLDFHGRYDLVVSPENAVQMVGLFPDVRVVLLRCGNLVSVEMPDQFNRMTLDFLRN
jgi:pimeloyl-ACP methyl ester carboxylesterase